MEALIVVDMQTDFTAAVVQRKDTRRVEVKPGDGERAVHRHWSTRGAQFVD